MNIEADAVHPVFLKLCERCKCRFAFGCPDEETPRDTVDLAKPTNDRMELAASPLYQRAVAELVGDAALAVDYAHNRGILHLDVKPSNLLIDGQGKLWITDFGASRPNSGSDSSASDGLVGTLCYMSPEQAFGSVEQLDCRSDVYSLGATLYELLTLERPFVHDSPQALLTQIAFERVKPPRHINKALPPDLDAIVVKAMACQREQRYATARSLSEDLQKYLRASTRRGRARKLGGSRRGPVVAGIFAVVTLVCLAVLVVTHRQKPSPGPVHQWHGHFYALTDERTDWVSAEAEAVAHGGHLITINNRLEQEFVVDTFLSTPNLVFWIGMTDAEKEGDWHWISGEPVSYTNWENPGEPNNHASRDPVTGRVFDEDYGVINWHQVFEPPRTRTCTWNDFLSIPNDDRIKGYRGIMEFATDPR